MRKAAVSNCIVTQFVTRLVSQNRPERSSTKIAASNTQQLQSFTKNKENKSGADRGTRTPTVSRQNLNLVRLPISPYPQPKHVCFDVRRSIAFNFQASKGKNRLFLIRDRHTQILSLPLCCLTSEQRFIKNLFAVNPERTDRRDAFFIH